MGRAVRVMDLFFKVWQFGVGEVYHFVVWCIYICPYRRRLQWRRNRGHSRGERAGLCSGRAAAESGVQLHESIVSLVDSSVLRMFMPVWKEHQNVKRISINLVSALSPLLQPRQCSRPTCGAPGTFLSLHQWNSAKKEMMGADSAANNKASTVICQEWLIWWTQPGNCNW